MKIAFLGAGSWATALAAVVAYNGYDVELWTRNHEDARTFCACKENTKYLSGIHLDEKIRFSSDAQSVLNGAEITVLATGAQSTGKIIKQFKKLIPEKSIVLNISKGIEQGTLSLMSEIAKELLPNNSYAVLSGPSFAREVAQRMPTAVIAASEENEVAKKIQDIFMNERFRVYTGDDVIGTELGGSLKNIIALGAGLLSGIGQGENMKAALITRGLYEIMKIGRKMGAKPSTFSGLSGIGDLFLTCSGSSSRNYCAGVLIGKGKSKEEAIGEIGMLVEGIHTTRSAFDLSEKFGIEMPITKEMYYVLYENKPINSALEDLMKRSKKHEMEAVFDEFSEE